MPAPATNVRVRPDLAESMMEHPLEMAQKPIGLEMFPVVEVDESEGTQGVIPSKEVLTPSGGERTGEGGYLREEIEFDEQDWATKENGGEGVIDQRKKHKYKNYFNQETLVAKVQRFKAHQRREIRCADIMANAGNFTGQQTAVGTPWSSHAAALPIDNVEEGVQEIWDREGILPNTLQLSWKQFRDLRLCDQIIDAIQAQGAGSSARAGEVTIEQLKTVFDIEHILIGGMPKNNANIKKNKSIRSIWSDTSAVLAYIDHSGSIEMPSFTRTYHWGEDGSTIDGLVEDYFEEKTRKHIIRVRQDTDEKIVVPTLGQQLTGIAV